MEYIIINSAKSKKQYRIDIMEEYVIDSSIFTPADFFSFGVSNYEGQVSDIISAGDEVFFYIDNKLTMNGYIDDFEVQYDANTNYAQITGRDKSSILLDNDSIPGTLYKMGLKTYLEKKITPYGIKNFEVSDNSPFDKIVVSPGDTEWGVIDKLCKDRGIFPMYDSTTLRCIKLRADTNMDYHFSNDIEGAIKFKTLNIKVSADVKDEVLVYGGNYSRSKDLKADKNIKGKSKKETSKDDKAKTKTDSTSNIQTLKTTVGDNTLALTKRKIVNNDDLENSTDANKIAKEELKNANRNAFVIEMDFQTVKPIFINKIAKITIKRLELECFMLIDSVRYTKTNSGGSMTHVIFKLIEGVKVTWKNHNIPLIPK